MTGSIATLSAEETTVHNKNKNKPTTEAQIITRQSISNKYRLTQIRQTNFWNFVHQTQKNVYQKKEKKTTTSKMLNTKLPINY